MTNNETSNWFDQLIKNIVKLFSSLFKACDRDQEEQKVHETRVTVDERAQDVSPPVEIDQSKDESLSLDLPSIERVPTSEDNIKVSRETERQFRREFHTKSEAFRIPILKALVNLGGSAKRQVVFEELEKIMRDQLTENDWNPLPSNKRMVRWQVIATNTRMVLLKEGLINVNPQKGMWIITEKGRKALEEMSE